MTQKKVLMLVVGGIQLLFAIQIKNKIFKEDIVDVVYRKIDIDEIAAKQVFDNVFKSKEGIIPPQKALKCFFNPQYAVSEYFADIKLNSYTDIFFWHPDFLYYFIYKYSVYNKNNYRWHIFPEGLELYIGGKPAFRDISFKYGYEPVYQMIKIMDKYIFGYPIKASEIIDDAYCIQKKYNISSQGIDIIEVPAFDLNESEYIGMIDSIFKYEKQEIENKLIIIDGGLSGNRYCGIYDAEKMDRLIAKLGRLLGKENVLLKRKHDIDLNQYPEEVIQNVTIYEDDKMPWELICFNNKLKNCVIISVMSSSIFFPYFLSKYKNETYVIDSKYLQYQTDETRLEQQRLLYRMISNDCSLYSVIETEEDVNKIIKKLKR